MGSISKVLVLETEHVPKTVLRFTLAESVSFTGPDGAGPIYPRGSTVLTLLSPLSAPMRLDQIALALDAVSLQELAEILAMILEKFLLEPRRDAK